jgi:hypothetical protein
MAPDGLIRVLASQEDSLKLTIELPGWLPFEFPVSITAVQGGESISVLQAAAPGDYIFKVPLVQPGLIKLLADQWFVPARLGMSQDTRQLCYRLVAKDLSTTG